MNGLFSSIRGLIGTRQSSPPISNRIGAQNYLVLGDKVINANQSLRSSGLEQAFKSALSGANSNHNMSDGDLAEAYAIGLTAFACVQVRARLVGSVPLIATIGDTRLETNNTENPAIRFLNDSSQLMAKIETSLAIWGKNYLHKRRNSAGYPVILDWINPALIRPEINKQTGLIQSYAINRQKVSSRDIIYGHTFNPNNPHDGISPYEVAMKSIHTEGNLMQMAASFFGNNARPDGLLTSEGHIDDADVLNLQKRWNAMFKGIDKQFRTGLLPGQWKYQTITPPPTDLAMNELTNIVRSNVLASFGLNAVLVGLGDAKDALGAQNTYREAWQQHIEFLAIPEVNFILGLLNNHWLPEFDSVYGAPIRIEIDYEKINAISRATAERSATAISMFDAGLIEHTESREYVGKPESEDGFKFNPQTASVAYNDGVLKLNEYRRYIGRDELPATEGDKFIWEVDPRHQGQQPPAYPFLSLPEQVNMSDLRWNKQNYLAVPQRSQSEVDGVVAQLLSGVRSQKAASVVEIGDLLPRSVDVVNALDNQLNELRQWRQKQRYHRKRCIKGGKDITPVRFETEHIAEPVQRLIEQGLEDGWHYGHVFDVAERAIRADDIPNEPFGATPEELEAYWQDLDALEADLSAGWLSYVKRFSQDIATVLMQDPTAEISASLLSAHHEQLIADWVGTEDEPGALHAVVLAGMANGNNILNNLAETLRSTRDAFSELKWVVSQQEAYEYALEYAGSLITQLDETTRKKIRAIIAKSVDEEWTLDQLSEALETVLWLDTDTPSDQVANRAKLITDSERGTAYNAGAQRRWESASVLDASWQTVNDGDVCKICRPLHGQSFNLSEGIYSQVLAQYVRYTAHGRCRCFQQPDITSIDLDALVADIA